MRIAEKLKSVVSMHSNNWALNMFSLSPFWYISGHTQHHTGWTVENRLIIWKALTVNLPAGYHPLQCKGKNKTIKIRTLMLDCTSDKLASKECCLSMLIVKKWGKWWFWEVWEWEGRLFVNPNKGSKLVIVDMSKTLEVSTEVKISVSDTCAELIKLRLQYVCM